MERHIVNKESAVRVIGGKTYAVRVINGRESLVERPEAAPVSSVARPPVHDAPAAYVDRYSAKATDLELLRRAKKGAELMAARAVQQAQTIGSLAQQAEDELNILAFQTVNAQDEGNDSQREQDHPDHSADAWTPTRRAELEERLKDDEAIFAEPIHMPVASAIQPSMENPFDAIIDNIGQPRKKRLPRGKAKNVSLADDEADGERKKKLSRKQKVVRLGAFSTLVVVAAGIPLAANIASSNKQADTEPAKPATTISPQEKEAIAKKANPDITPASMALGQCLADGAGLLSGHASGTSSVAWVFKAADGTLKGAQTPDKKYPPIEVESAPFNVAACAPADARSTIVTMKDNNITVDRSKVYPEVGMVVGGTVTPTVQDFAATPEVGLTDAGAKALNAAQADTANKNSVATIAYANLARAIAQKGSVDLGRVEAQMDTDLLQSVNDQIAAFYKKQGKDAPTFNLTLTGDYLDPKVIDPAALPDILTKTKDIVRLTSSTLTALDFSTTPSTTPTPTPTGK